MSLEGTAPFITERSGKLITYDSVPATGEYGSTDDTDSTEHYHTTYKWRFVYDMVILEALRQSQLDNDAQSINIVGDYNYKRINRYIDDPNNKVDKSRTLILYNEAFKLLEITHPVHVVLTKSVGIDRTLPVWGIFSKYLIYYVTPEPGDHNCVSDVILRSRIGKLFPRLFHLMIDKLPVDALIRLKTSIEQKQINKVMVVPRMSVNPSLEGELVSFKGLSLLTTKFGVLVLQWPLLNMLHLSPVIFGYGKEDGVLIQAVENVITHKRRNDMFIA